MPKFVLMFRDSSVPDFSPEEMQAAIDRYRAWGAKVRGIAGERLKEGGRVIKAGSVTDGPYTESKEVIGGFQIIEARDYEDAIHLCRDHPHLEHGTIELREVDHH